jgi:hypothetical protein
MASRRYKAALAALIGLVAIMAPLATAAPAGAAEQGAIALTMQSGVLDLRGSDTQPAELKTPTTITGPTSVNVATGAITGASLAVAPLDFQFDITTPINATVYVNAVFSEVNPGTVTGTVTKQGPNEGKVTIKSSVKVDLHIEVSRPAILSADCTAAPISIELLSTVPYDITAKTVTLTDPNFTVPEVPTTAECAGIIADGVNERLEGSGHSLTMQMNGELAVPTTGSEPTTTSLTVAPASSEPGDEVVLTSTVARKTPPGGTPIPTGLVEFRDGEVVLGTAPLDGAGVASLPTTELSVGAHQITATYLGDDTYQPSDSAAAEHVVSAEPTVAIAMGTAVLIDGQPRPATITVSNPAEFGALVENVRVDLKVARTGALSNAVLDENRLKIEWLNGDTWEQVPLTWNPLQEVVGTIGPLTGFALPAGTDHQIRLRISALAYGTVPHPTTCLLDEPTCPGPAAMTASLSEVNPETGDVVEPLGEVVHNFNLVESVRRPTAFTFATGFPRPHTVRQGYTTQIFGNLTPAVGGLRPGGTAKIFLDGEPTLVRTLNAPLGAPLLSEVPVTGSINAFLLLPLETEPGTHVVTIHYSGNAFFTPLEKSTTLTVLPAHGGPEDPDPLFVCREEGFTTQAEEGTNVQFDVTLPPAVVSGESTAIDVSAAVLRMSRQHTSGLSAPWVMFDEDGVVYPVGTIPLNSITFDLGDNGTGRAESLQREGSGTISGPNPGTDENVDQTITLGDPSAELTIEGDPGDVVPIELEEISLSYVLSASEPTLYSMICTPVGGPVELGEVEIAGTEVTATPSPAREITDEVTLDASTFPADAAGTVSFSSDVDGALGSDAVDAGSAELATDELTPGVHEITASFNATDPEVPDTTGTTTVVVTYSPRTGTQAFVVAALTDFIGVAEEEAVLDGASKIAGGMKKPDYLGQLSVSDEYLTHVIQEMYQDTLGREGDPDGVEYWVGQLRAGVSVAKVAAAFYGSPEYFARVGGTNEAWVTDLYEVLLGRAPDPGGLDYWSGQIAKITKGGVAFRFFQTEESGRFRVADLYDYFLDREPSEADLDFWTPIVRKRGDLVLAVFLASSDEYADLAEERFPIVED